MTFSAWRITKEVHAKSAFSGEGARLYGGRWNSRGIALIYTAQSQSLAVLELLVHLDSPELLKRYVLFEVTIHPSLIEVFDLANYREIGNPIRLRTKCKLLGMAGSAAAVRRYCSCRAPWFRPRAAIC